MITAGHKLSRDGEVTYYLKGHPNAAPEFEYTPPPVKKRTVKVTDRDVTTFDTKTFAQMEAAWIAARDERVVIAYCNMDDVYYVAAMDDRVTDDAKNIILDIVDLKDGREGSMMIPIIAYY